MNDREAESEDYAGEGRVETWPWSPTAGERQIASAFESRRLKCRRFSLEELLTDGGFASQKPGTQHVAIWAFLRPLGRAGKGNPPSHGFDMRVAPIPPHAVMDMSSREPSRV